MVITKELFASYLNCQTKAYLKSSAASCQQSKFGMWRSSWENNLRRQGMDFLQEKTGRKTVENPTEAELSNKGSAVYVNCSIEAGELRSSIDAAEKLELRGVKAQWIPYRCRLDKRAERHERLLLAYDALCLQTFTGVPVRVGKLVDGVGNRAKKVRLNSLLKAVQDHV